MRVFFNYILRLDSHYRFTGVHQQAKTLKVREQVIVTKPQQKTWALYLKLGGVFGAKVIAV